jgi:hypothetical protein
MRNTTAALAGLLCLAAVTPLFAAKNAKLKPLLGTPGEVVLEESFSGPSLGKLWTVNKGEWKVADGTVVGSEKASDKHAAVLTCKVPNHNSAIRLSFKLGKAKQFHVSFNKVRGHLFRVMVTPGSLVVRTDKPGKKSKTRPVALGKAAVKFAPDQWYTMLVEVRGDQVAVQTDNGATVKGTHSSLDVAKPNYRFILRGDGLQLDDVTIWKAKR